MCFFLTEPLNNIMLHISLGELGILMYMIETVMMFNPTEMPENDVPKEHQILQQITEKSKVSDTAETSTVNPTDVPETSKETPSAKSFYFELTPVHTLKLVIASLSDSTFNGQGFGRIDVTDKGFKITVWRLKDVGHLWLEARGLKDFQCCKPVDGKIVHLPEIYYHLTAVDDKDTVTIYQVDGSNKLFFMFGSDHSGGFSVNLLENIAQIKKFPQSQSFVNILLPSKHLHFIYEAGEQLVTLRIKDNTVGLKVGKKEIKKVKITDSGLQPQQRLCVQFKWTYPESLKLASCLNAAYAVFCITEPPNSIMFRFFLGDLGDLWFIKDNASMDMS